MTKPDLKLAWERDFFVETMMLRTRYNQAWFAKRDGRMVLPWHCPQKKGCCAECKELYTPEVVEFMEKSIEF